MNELSENRRCAVCGRRKADRESNCRSEQIDRARVHSYTGGGIAATLEASYYKGAGARNGKEREFVAIETEKPKRKYIVRRLTPTECARLQGFPDWWCDGADGSDSAMYKMWGNGIALPCAVDVIGRLAKEMEETPCSTTR